MIFQARLAAIMNRTRGAGGANVSPPSGGVTAEAQPTPSASDVLARIAHITSNPRLRETAERVGGSAQDVNAASTTVSASGDARESMPGAVASPPLVPAQKQEPNQNPFLAEVGGASETPKSLLESAENNNSNGSMPFAAAPQPSPQPLLEF